MKDFVPYNEALKLKELGFDERCFGHYWENLFYFETTHSHPSTMPNSPESCLAPIFSQAFRWFRDKYKLVGLIEIGTQEYSFIIFNEVTDSRKITSSMNGTYEEAELACLKKLIQIVKENI